MNFYDEDNEMIDNGLDQYKEYENYLDDQINEMELFYLEDKELARKLIEVGYYGKGEVLSREQFDKKKDEIDKAKKQKDAK